MLQTIIGGGGGGAGHQTIEISFQSVFLWTF